MQKYIGCKMVEAERCVKVNGKLYDCLPDMDPTKGAIIEYGYKVRYEDGYESFSPKAVFEKAYMPIGNNITITQDNVAGFIKEVYSMTIGEKTTFVKATLINGFELCETSSCVDPKNYDEKLGIQCCMERIYDKIWHLLGFLLQTAVGGVKMPDDAIMDNETYEILRGNYGKQETDL